jgi:hypothetical protein
MKRQWGILVVCFIALIGLTPRGEVVAAKHVKSIKPNLSDIATGKGWTVVNRAVSVINEGGKKGIRFDDRKDVGVAWLENYSFTDGTIEFDVKGKNVLQKSFVGIAFQAVDAVNYDVIYFRPFNFKSDDPIRHAHAVQYVAAPDHGWKELRDAFPGKYEQPVDPAPDPDRWFHARVVVDGKSVSVYVNGAKTPSLSIEKLTASRAGKIGLWVGDDSDGAFANLRITPAK